MKVHFDLTSEQAAALWQGVDGDIQTHCPACHNPLKPKGGWHSFLTEATMTVKEQYGDYNANDLLVHYDCARKMRPHPGEPLPVWFIKALNKAAKEGRISFETDKQEKLVIYIRDEDVEESYELFGFSYSD